MSEDVSGVQEEILPLFPLSTVLFPAACCRADLETRYIDMVGHACAKERRLAWSCWSRAGARRDTLAIRHRVCGHRDACAHHRLHSTAERFARHHRAGRVPLQGELSVAPSSPCGSCRDIAGSTQGRTGRVCGPCRHSSAAAGPSRSESATSRSTSVMHVRGWATCGSTAAITVAQTGAARTRSGDAPCGDRARGAMQWTVLIDGSPERAKCEQFASEGPPGAACIRGERRDGIKIGGSGKPLSGCLRAWPALPRPARFRTAGHEALALPEAAGKVPARIAKPTMTSASSSAQGQSLGTVIAGVGRAQQARENIGG